jgi:hypothetical protein
MILSASAMAVISFAFSLGLTEIAAFWCMGNGRGWERLRLHLPLLANPLIAAMTASVIAMFYHRFPAAPLAAVPLIALMYFWTRAYRAKLPGAPAN